MIKRKDSKAQKASKTSSWEFRARTREEIEAEFRKWRQANTSRISIDQHSIERASRPRPDTQERPPKAVNEYVVRVQYQNKRGQRISRH
jgi:hypothetical protein